MLNKVLECNASRIGHNFQLMFLINSNRPLFLLSSSKASARMSIISVFMILSRFHLHLIVGETMRLHPDRHNFDLTYV
jgi:hypothetical protein